LTNYIADICIIMVLQLKEVLEKNKVHFEKEFGKKWDDDLGAYLSYLNLLNVRSVLTGIEKLGELQQAIELKLDRNAAKIDNLEKAVNRKI